MNIFGMFVAIFAGAFMAIAIADYYDQPYDGYLFLLMILAGFFIQIVIFIVRSEIDEEKEA